MKYIITLAALVLSTSSLAQNVFEPITRPIANIHAYLGPESVGFENNLMNYISDELRVDETEINQSISCIGDAGSKGEHFHEKRNITIRCENQEVLMRARHDVSKFYGEEVGHNLKYAYRSGGFIFAVCNYDSNGEHKHSKDHYVCRVPIGSKEKDIETFCYNMGFFHRTCNPHKALVAAEIIPINSRRRWKDIDRSILVRFLENNKESMIGEVEPGFIQSISDSIVKYAEVSRGSATADKRYPKSFIGRSYMCSERLISSDSKYVKTEISCNTLIKINRGSSKVGSLVFQKRMERLKQKSVSYPMIRGERSSVDD